ncbi:hypothetical protein D3C86_2146700 [compost metagenome]
MINGMERTPLIAVLINRFTRGAGRTPPLSVTTKVTPSSAPRISANTEDHATIYSVCCSPPQSSSTISSFIV